MPLLDALLAFALTMLALASVATLLVEIVHRLAQVRAKGLRKMLERIFDQEIRPRLEAELEELSGAAEDAKRRFLEEMLKNPIADSSSLQPALRSLEKMSTEEFLRRLGQTEAGGLLRQRVRDGAEEIGHAVDRLARKFDDYGAAASDYFARRAKVLSVTAGIAVAFICNVDAVRILNGYLHDSVAAQAVIAQSDVFLRQWQEATEGLAALQRSSDTSDRSDTSDASDVGSDALATVAARLAKVGDSLEGLQGGGLPVGYDRFPVEVDLCTWTFWTWFLIVLLTGFLLGLGGPFWFDIVVRLSQVRQVLRGGGAAAGAGPPPQAPAAPATTAQRVAFFEEDAAASPL